MVKYVKGKCDTIGLNGKTHLNRQLYFCLSEEWWLSHWNNDKINSFYFQHIFHIIGHVLDVCQM